MLSRVEQLENNQISKTKLLEEPITVELRGNETGDFGKSKLLDSIENYSYLLIEYDCIFLNGNGEGSGEETLLVSTENLNYNSTTKISWDDNSTIALEKPRQNPEKGGIGFYFLDSENLQVGYRFGKETSTANAEIRIRNIYGIKKGK